MTALFIYLFLSYSVIDPALAWDVRFIYLFIGEIPVWWRRAVLPSLFWVVFSFSPGDADKIFLSDTEHCRGLKSAQVSQGTMPGVNTTNSNN